MAQNTKKVAPPPAPPTGKKGPEFTGGAYTSKADTASADRVKAMASQFGLGHLFGGGGGGGGGGGATTQAKAEATGGGGGGGGGQKGGLREKEWDSVSDMVKDHFTGILSGKTKRFSDDMIEGMKDETFASTMGQVKSQIRQMDGRMARRGMLRSGLGARAEADLRRAGLSAYSKGIKDIMLKKAMAEFDDKNKALDQAQAWVGQRQNYELGRERNQIAREQIAAQMSIASMQNKTARAGISAANSRFRSGQKMTLFQTAVGMSTRTGAGGQDFGQMSNLMPR